ncbi:MAG: outer membrane protein transport protein [Desulfobacterales bacterium]
MRFFLSRIFSVALLILIMCPSIRAGGLWLYEEGTPDLGTAGAGRAAAAKDAATAGGNPAGMTRLKGSQMTAGAQALLPQIKFDVDDRSFGGGNGGNAGYFTPTASFFYVHSLTSDLKLGVAVGSFFGLGLDYDDDWAGRYYFQEGKFLTFGINPVAAYRINKYLSVGGGFSVVASNYEAKTALRNLEPGNPPDGRLKFDDYDIGFGGNAGLMIEPKAGTRFGITYRSKVDLEYKDKPNLNGVGFVLQAALNATGLAGSKVTLDMELPQAVMVSAYHEFTDRLAIMGNVGWQEWSSFGNIDVSIDSDTSTSATQDLGYDDTWHYAFGVQYRIAEPWLISTGFAYDTSPADSGKKRTPALPLDRQIRVGAGVQYELNPDVTLGAAYEYLDLGDANIDRTGGILRGDLKGDYKKNQIHFIGLNVVWKF